MKIGIIGLPQTGKTTLFTALSRGSVQVAQAKTNLASVPLQDEDLAFLASVFSPKKTTPAAAEFVDVPGMPAGQEHASRRNELLKDIKVVDALVEVFDGFNQAPEPASLCEQVTSFELDLALVDLDVIERRLERMKKEKMTPALELEQDLLARCQDCLSGGLALRGLGLSAEERRVLSSYSFISIKPVLRVVNVTMSEEQAAHALESAIQDMTSQQDSSVMVLDAKLEHEIAELPADEQASFLSEFGLAGSALDSFVTRAYQLLGLETFYTAGEDECKAWVVTAGTNARDAAGKIHSDIARGFIAAEVISIDDFRKCGSSFKGAKEKGLLRIEGEHYIIKNKEIAHFRFNVSH